MTRLATMTHHEICRELMMDELMMDVITRSYLDSPERLERLRSEPPRASQEPRHAVLATREGPSSGVLENPVARLTER